MTTTKGAKIENGKFWIFVLFVIFVVQILSSVDIQAQAALKI